MPYHPSLKEVLEKDDSISEEWAEFSVKGLSWNMWVSAERVIGEQPDPEYHFSCSSLRSEYRTFSYDNVFLNFEITTTENIKNLAGDSMPLGAFNYYSENDAIVNITITQNAYDDIIKLVLSGTGDLTVRIAIPKWEDPECKCVPITGYQLIFNTTQDEKII